jgi:HSP20 family protein
VADEVEVRRDRPARLWDWFDAPEISRWFDSVKPWFSNEGLMRIEQEVSDDTMTIRAEIPGIDPDKDVDITVEGDVLRIRAERRSEKKEGTQGRTRSEFHYGSFERRVRVPSGVGIDDIKATYKDGVLQVVVPCKVESEGQPRKVAIERA